MDYENEDKADKSDLAEQEASANKRAAVWFNLPGHVPIIMYNADEPLRNLLKLEGTTVPLVLTRGDFWVVVILHVALSLAYNMMDGAKSVSRGGVQL